MSYAIPNPTVASPSYIHAAPLEEVCSLLAFLHLNTHMGIVTDIADV